MNLPTEAPSILAHLENLEARTRQYAAFQSRKSGLASALGAFLACLMFVFGMYAGERGIKAESWIGLALGMPILWTLLKGLIAQKLYRKWGNVKASQDMKEEGKRWRWIFGLGFFLLAFQCYLSFHLVYFLGNSAEGVKNLQEWQMQSAALWSPWLGVMLLPLLYMAISPFAIHGPEEARAYGVLTAQSLLFMLGYLQFKGLPVFFGSWVVGALVVLSVQISIFGWAALAMIRGWREHREYRALMTGLPTSTEG